MGLGGAVRRVAMTMLLCLMLPMCMQTALAQESQGTEGDWEYTYAAGEATLFRYNGTATVVTTPTTLVSKSWILLAELLQATRFFS